MTAINEFYLSKQGRACHVDLDDMPRFLSLGFDAFAKGVEILSSKALVIKDFYEQQQHSLFSSIEKIEKAEYKNIIKNIHIEPSKIKHSLVNLTTNITNELKYNSKHIKEDIKNRNFKTIGILGIASTLVFASGLGTYSHFNNKSLNTNTEHFNNKQSLDSNAQDVNKKETNKEEINKKETHKKETHKNETSEDIKHHFLNSIFKSKVEAFTKLLLITEKKSKIFYKDNDGIATLYGWNPTKNDKKLNLMIAQGIGLNKKEQNAIEAVSANPNTPTVQYIPANLKKMVFSDWQLKTSAKIMMGIYEQEFLSVLKIKATEKNQDYELLLKGYNSLPNNQQAVLLHMTYKVGVPHLLKYNDFFDNLFAYIKNPSSNNLKVASQSFEYNFKTREGDMKRDINVEKKHESFFLDCLHGDVSDKNSKHPINNVQSCRQLFAQVETKPKKNI